MAPVPSPLRQRFGPTPNAARVMSVDNETGKSDPTVSALARASEFAAWKETRIGTLSLSHRRHGGLLARLIQKGSHDIRVQHVDSYPGLHYRGAR